MNRQVDDKEFILSPWNWPNLTLPLKRYIDNDMECGFLIPQYKGCTVYLGYFYDLLKKPLDDFPVKKYSDVDSLLADGWMVD